MTTPDPFEEGRRLASHRDDLIAAGVDPSTLAVPLAPTPDPFPWEEVADYVAPIDDDEDPADDAPPLVRPATAVELSDVVLDSRSAFLLLDDLANEQTRRDTTVRIRETLVDVVRQRAAVRRADRPDKVASATDVRLEAVGLADDAETLDALAGAFTAAAGEARALAGDLVDDVPRARVSIKVADGRGFELKVLREQRRELSVAFDEVIDVIAAATIAGYGGTPSEVVNYGAGVREGIAALRDVLSTSPTFRSTALNSLATRLEDAGEDALAKRLRAAYARVDVGDPRVKLERKPLKGEGGES